MRTTGLLLAACLSQILLGGCATPQHHGHGRIVDDLPHGREPRHLSSRHLDTMTALVPAGQHLLVVVADVNVETWRNRRLEPLRGSLRWAPAKASLWSWSKLAARTMAPEPEATACATTAAAPLARQRVFAVYDQRHRTYHQAMGQLVHSTKRFAFYEEPSNARKLAASQLSSIGERVEEQLDSLIKLLRGRPSDVDGNQRIIVFFSRTAARVHPRGQSYVDTCNLTEQGCAGTPRGEVIYFWDLEALVKDPEKLAGSYLPRNILHETIHLLQQARLRRSGRQTSRPVPAALYEGLAELYRMRSGSGARAKRRGIDQALQSGHGPFQAPYRLGALYVWWLGQQFGEATYARLLYSLSLAHVHNPVLLSTAMEEPLTYALFWAAVHGKGRGLKDLQPQPPRRLTSQPEPLEVGYSQAAVFALSLDKPRAIQVRVSGATPARVLLYPTPY